MGFINDIKTSFRKYFDFSSRSSRSEYWFFSLFVFLISIAGYFIEYIIIGDALFEKLLAEPPVKTYSEIIITLAILTPSISLSVRRLHDVNRSGWWLLIALTLIGIIPLLYWGGFKKGVESDNKFGSNPLKKSV
jgi:uncharacterized membrane protein YhaH (DUF805 family)